MGNEKIGSKLFRGTAVIVFIGIVAKLSSFIVEAILAAYLGTNYISDAYHMINSVHTVVYPMMSVGIWKVFLPLYKSHIAKKEIELASSITNKSLTFFTLASCIVTLVLLLIPTAVVTIIAPGFEGETRNLCIRLVRISAPMYVFIIASAVYASVLQCHDRFLGSQIREVVSHLPTIITAVFFYHSFGVEALAVALVVGGILRLLVELPFVNWEYRYKPDFGFKTKEFVLMLKRMPSALVSAGVAQINSLVDKAMASTLPTGTVSGLNYGNRLVNVFSGLLSSAIATALYPQMIELIAMEKRDELGRLIEKIISIFCIIMFPITIACVLYRTELVSVAFQRGAFDSKSVDITSNVFALYSLGLFFVACNTVVSNVFYGHGDTKTPMHISIANLMINVVLNLILIRFMGVNGLALATSLSAFLTFFIRLFYAKQIVTIKARAMIIPAMKILFASLIACVLPRIWFNTFPLNTPLVLILSAIIGIVLYFVLINILKVAEMNDLVSILKNKLKNT